MGMNAALEEASVGGSQDAVWGVTGIMSKDILPDDPDERRRRRRLHALRAMDRLGLLGEKNVKATLAGIPQLRWLADEWGARWDILAELGRIGEPEAFEEALRWALENRTRPEQSRAHLWLFGSGGLRPAEAGGAVRSPLTERATGAPHARRATGKEEYRRC